MYFTHNFLRNVTFGVISTTEWRHSKPQTTSSKKVFGLLSFVKIGCLGLLADLSYSFPSLLFCYNLS